MNRTARFTRDAFTLNVRITTAPESGISLPLVTLPAQPELKAAGIVRGGSIFSNIPKITLPVTVETEEPVVYEDDIDVSKIDLAEFMVGETKDAKGDRKNAKSGTPHGQLDPMKQYMDDGRFESEQESRPFVAANAFPDEIKSGVIADVQDRIRDELVQMHETRFKIHFSILLIFLFLPRPA